MPLRASDLPLGVRRRLGIGPARRASKFNAIAVVSEGYRFDSLKEERRFFELRCLEKAGQIENLQVHPIYWITRDGELLARYTGDFRYVDRRTGAWVIEDVKGGKATRTRDYVLRKKLVEQQYGIEIREI